MKRTAVVAGLFALTFATAEGVRPTHFVPKKIAARALLVRSQSVPGGASDSLDSELLDDVPRIYPNAIGTLRVLRRSDGSFTLTGVIADPLDGTAGAAAFLESDGKRMNGLRTSYGVEPQPRAFSIIVLDARLGPGPHRLFVGLISADQRGFFRLTDPVLVRVDR